jgi:hypothetical protein
MLGGSFLFLTIRRDMIRYCKVHGYTPHRKRVDGGYRCRKCSSENKRNKRNTLKIQAVEYLGGLGIVVSSGYRCKELNVAIGGAKTSRHMTGLAVDFTVPRYGNPLTVAKAIRDSGIPYNQLIHEYGKWVHLEVIPVGMDEKDAKKQDLSIKKGTGYTKGLT